MNEVAAEMPRPCPVRHRPAISKSNDLSPIHGAASPPIQGLLLHLLPIEERAASSSPLAGLTLGHIRGILYWNCGKKRKEAAAEEGGEWKSAPSASLGRGLGQEGMTGRSCGLDLPFSTYPSPLPTSASLDICGPL